MASVFVTNLHDARLALVAQKDACLLAHQMGQKRPDESIIAHAFPGDQDKRSHDVIHPVSQRERTFAVYPVHYTDRASLFERKFLLDFNKTHQKVHRYVLYGNLDKIKGIVHGLSVFTRRDMVEKPLYRCCKRIWQCIYAAFYKDIGNMLFLFIELPQIDKAAHKT